MTKKSFLNDLSHKNYKFLLKKLTNEVILDIFIKNNNPKSRKVKIIDYESEFLNKNIKKPCREVAFPDRVKQFSLL